MQLRIFSRLNRAIAGAARGYCSSQQERERLIQQRLEKEPRLTEAEALFESGLRYSVNPSVVDPDRFQVLLSAFIDKSWYAWIHFKNPGKRVIADAVKIINAVCPQRYGPNGRSISSFWQRERLLNLLIEHYWQNGYLPCGPTILKTEHNWAPLPYVSWRLTDGELKICPITKVSIPLQGDFPFVGSFYQPHSTNPEILELVK